VKICSVTTLIIIICTLLNFSLYAKSSSGSKHHPMEIVPTVMTSKLPLKNGKIWCTTCHTKHTKLGDNNSGVVPGPFADGDGSYYLRESGNSVCEKCHKDKTTADSNHRDFSVGGCQTCHSIHFAGAKLLKSNDSSECTLCHVDKKGSIHKTGMMVTGKEEERGILLDENRLMCQTCHNPHKNRAGKFVRENDELGKLCSACHGVEQATKLFKNFHKLIK